MRIERKIGAGVAVAGALLITVSGVVPASARSGPPTGFAQATGLRFADTANATSKSFGGWMFGSKTATSVTTVFKVPNFGGCTERIVGVGVFAIFETGTTTAPNFNASGLILDCAVLGGEAAAVLVDGIPAIASQPVFTGDLIQSKIVSSATKTTATVKDLTAGHTFTLTKSGAGGAPLLERIGGDAENLNSNQLPVANFGKVTFTKGAISGKALGSVTPRSGVNMQNSKGVLQILTGPLSGTAENSFRITWKHS